MPTFQCDTSALLWDATAVSNAFLCEFMPTAPDGYVKVYLYGLMYAHGGMLEEEGVLDDLAKALEMQRADVEQALRYWERCRLLPPLHPAKGYALDPFLTVHSTVNVGIAKGEALNCGVWGRTGPIVSPY